MTAEALKLWLSTPAALFLVMLLGSLANGLANLVDAKRNGGSSSLLAYLGHWQESLATLITNALGFATLVVTDQLNFASALGIGYAANSAADLIRSGGRSASLVAPKQGGFARVGMLLAIMIGAMLALAACTTTPAKVIQTGCAQDESFDVKRCAKTIGETYEIYQKRVAEIVKDPATPADVKARLQKFEREATPAVVEVLRSSRTFDQIASEVAAGTTEAEQLTIANANLQRYISEALPRLYALIDAFGG